MAQHTIATPGRGLVEITAEAVVFVRESNIADGLLTVFCRHTSASLLIQKNADPDVRHDLDAFFTKLSPDGQPGWRQGGSHSRVGQSSP
ncbi:MAG: YjbQ family protein [Sulfurisoma sp.]|nr:YjbQ family protein [Sulfurisoma sp.]